MHVTPVQFVMLIALFNSCTSEIIILQASEENFFMIFQPFSWCVNAFLRADIAAAELNLKSARETRMEK